MLLSSCVAVGLTTFTLASPAVNPESQQAVPAQGAPGVPAVGPKEGGRGDAPLPETRPVVWGGGKKKVLLVGGGSSHNFTTFFNGTDTATLAGAGFSVNYTANRDQAVKELPAADVAS